MNRVELQALAEREREALAQFRCRILCCASTPCLASGAQPVIDALAREVKEKGLEAQIKVVSTGCMGPCSRGPMVILQMAGQPDTFYERMTPESALQILRQHAGEGNPVKANVLPSDIPFFTKQVKNVLANSGYMDPERIEDYIARDGYTALAHALREMTPEEICDVVTRSGLGGRGGAGYATGLKWNLVRKSEGERKYIIANGDEGDPGAYMDRSLMESDPHRVVEGMAIAGYAVGAEQGYLYVRGEYPVAAKRLEKAIRAAERNNLLGSRILDSQFNFRLDVRIGAGAFVCGEETALMASVMGRRGEPRPRPPFPSERGLWGSPTLINNVETFGNIFSIILKGDKWYSSIGTEKSKGTKIFALAGKINNTGLIEVPMGITLREIIFEIGGGIPDGREFKAVQTGGPSGGCIPKEHLDTPMDYERLKALGSIMGSGGMIIMDSSSCMPDVAKYFMEFCMDESCGKCVPCRAGTVQLHRILQRITSGAARPDDIRQLEELCTMVRECSLCGLGQSAPNAILSTLRYFRDEYEAHIRDRKCPAGVCKMTEPPVTELAEALVRKAQDAAAKEAR
jgi:bidirectional [NiFe] hydrogenase diaphorase subunit